MSSSEEERQAAATLLRRKHTRAGHRASATRMQGQVTDALRDPTPDVDRLTLLRTTMREKLDTLNKLDLEIIEHIPTDDIAEEIKQADECKEKMYESLGRIEKVLNGSTAVTPPSALVPSAVASGAAAHGARARGQVKLPKISLPHFSGNVTRWRSFWDSYESAIHKNDTLTDVEKFNYLKSLLERSAYDAIAGLTLSDANYVEAVAILQKRFGNKQVIISKHMEVLLNLDPVSSVHKLRELRRLYDTVESHTRSLRSLGIEPASYGAMLSSVFLAKLPQEVRIVVSRKSLSKDEPSMEEMMKAFEEELTARERVSANDRTGKRSERTDERSSVLFTGAQETGTCCYCRQEHESKNCTTVSEVNARRQILRREGRCYVCLRKGHVSRACRANSRCQYCKGKHHASICEGRTNMTRMPPVSLIQPDKGTLNIGATPYLPTTATFCADQMKSVLLQTARCVVQNPKCPQNLLELRLLMDSGSQKSYLTERARKVLGLKPVGSQSLAIATFGSEREQVRVCSVVEVNLCLKGYPTLPMSMFVVPTICSPLACQPISVCVKHNRSLSRLDFADKSDGQNSLQVDMLVGSDYYWSLVMGSVRKFKDGPTAVQTKLGWVLSGPTQIREAESYSVNLATTHVLMVKSTTKSLEEQLNSFWEMENLGIAEREKTLYDDFTAHISFRNGRYQVALPWKEYREPLSDNYLLSLRRLRGLLHRLKYKPTVLQEYDQTIKTQLESGVIEFVPDGELQTTQVHYLPHHPVVREDKSTTKLRVVYDASARDEGPSLNDCLYKGPKFNQLILDLLLRFRTYRVPLTADVEKAFLNIAVEDKDRDVLRFLWIDDVAKQEPELRIYRFTRVVFGVSASPFLLNATIKFHLERFRAAYETVVECLLQSTYVDDIIAGADSEQEALSLYAQSKELFKLGGFNLRKFTTSSRSLQQRIHELEEVSTQCLTPDHHSNDYPNAVPASSVDENSSEHKVLGVPWNTTCDCLIFDISELAQVATKLLPTKRNVVSLAGRFYDPLGFLTPVTIRFKLLFQRLCQGKVAWDDLLSGDCGHEWTRLLSDMKQSEPILVPRSYFHCVDGPVCPLLCGFSDASLHAYAAVVYLRLRGAFGVTVSFVASKTKVAPVKPTQTIPRLELLGALLLSRLIVSVLESLKPRLPQIDVRCYTDSTVALYWVKGVSKEWRPFIQNRADAIRQNVPPQQWNHCPGSSNPADLPSRGLTMSELAASELWREGPEWLHVNPCSDIELESLSMPEECAAELKRSGTLVLVNTVSSSTVSDLIDCSKFSSLSKLLRTTAQVLRAVERFKQLCSDSTVTITHITKAEFMWVRDAQRSVTESKNFGSHKQQFNLFKDDHGVWRCKGRLSNLEAPYEVKNPVLLPRDHQLTKLIVLEAHERVCHSGVKATITEIRSKFWVPKIRSLVRRILHRCVLCKRLEGIAFKPPPPPPLPPSRMKQVPAFTYTGVDFAGPIHVRGQGCSHKAWICLFTCFVTRAVYLDAVEDQSTVTFLRCVKRFTSRRGLPPQFISDNGKSFIAAAKYIRGVFQNGEVKEYLTNLGSEWTFNVERAPWWGGAFERLVKSTKRCLRKLIGRAQVSFDELITLLAEVECVLNSRPLTYVSASDTEEPLTPSHLITGRRIRNLPDHLSHIHELDDVDYAPASGNELNRRMKYINNLLNHFWKRWRNEYVHELRELHSYAAKKQEKPTTISVGDIVVIHDEQLPRGLWKLGKVESLMKGHDGQVRGVTLKTTSKDGQRISLNRPVQRLYPLEVCTESVETASTTNNPTETTSPAPSVEPGENRGRLSRSTAQRSRETWKAILSEPGDSD